VSSCITASCLAHHDRIFWHHQFKAWVHTSCHPCEALAGDPGPDALACAYCKAKLDIDGAGKLWVHLPGGRGWWEHHPAGCYPRMTWHDGKWSGACPASPEGVHEHLAVRAG
jgi:hypothetical protein